MKIYRMSALQALGFLLPAGILLAQEARVDLYLEPDIASQWVASVSLDDPRLGTPAPVMDEARAAIGWQVAEFEGPVTGYVPDAKIGKDLLPVDNTPIYSQPEADSPVLGLYRDADRLEIIDTGNWWKLEIETVFPVYFVLDSIPALPPVSGEAIVELDQDPRPDSDPVIFETPPLGTAPSARAAESGEQETRPLPAPVSPGLTGKSFEGTFMESQRRFGLFSPKEPFFLADSRGRRIAWIDTSEILVPGSLRAFLGKRVIIHGKRKYLQPSGDWILQARNMRLK
ncbi:MAG: hypothetical protein R6V45_13785 [Oceanipulchritudo sp.]